MQNNAQPLRNNLPLLLVAIIAAGILSRTLHTGWMIADKYLGDALYAAMVYVIVRIAFRNKSGMFVLALASAIMLALELFQLTGIPAELYASGNLVVRLFARLLGTQFSLADLAAYAIGLLAIHVLPFANKKS